eukprot:COSAG01_NODE_27268_length_690_cov_0.886633_1_plen_52_part_10
MDESRDKSAQLRTKLMAGFHKVYTSSEAQMFRTEFKRIILSTDACSREDVAK